MGNSSKKTPDSLAFVFRELKGLFVFLLFVSAVYFVFRLSPLHDKFNVSDIGYTLLNIGAWAVPVYVLCYLILPLFFFPVSPLCMASGVIFGSAFGFLLSAISYMLNTWLAFYLSRGMFRERIVKVVTGRGLVIDEKLSSNGVLFSFLLRFVPISPVGLQNYVAGLSGITWGQYTIGTALGGLPWVFIFVYMGDSLLRPGSKEFVISVSLWLFMFLVSVLILIKSKDRFSKMF